MNKSEQLVASIKARLEKTHKVFEIVSQEDGILVRVGGYRFVTKSSLIEKAESLEKLADNVVRNFSESVEVKLEEEPEEKPKEEKHS